MLAISLVALSLPCLAMALAPESVLRLWLRNDTIAASNAEAFRLILIGIALMAIYSPMSSLLLVERRYKAMIVVAAIVLLSQLLVLLAFVGTLGACAAALAWLAWGIVHTGATVRLWPR
jgi:O-antigen/teichoic acid export membrane protein